jgi:hypothetical protein
MIIIQNSFVESTKTLEFVIKEFENSNYRFCITSRKYTDCQKFIKCEGCLECNCRDSTNYIEYKQYCDTCETCKNKLMYNPKSNKNWAEVRYERGKTWFERELNREFEKSGNNTYEILSKMGIEIDTL